MHTLAKHANQNHLLERTLTGKEGEAGAGRGGGRLGGGHLFYATVTLNSFDVAVEPSAAVATQENVIPEVGLE